MKKNHTQSSPSKETQTPDRDFEQWFKEIKNDLWPVLQLTAMMLKSQLKTIYFKHLSPSQQESITEWIRQCPEGAQRFLKDLFQDQPSTKPKPSQSPSDPDSQNSSTKRSKPTSKARSSSKKSKSPQLSKTSKNTAQKTTAKKIRTSKRTTSKTTKEPSRSKPRRSQIKTSKK